MTVPRAQRAGRAERDERAECAERGSLALEFALIGPVLLVLLSLLVAAGSVRTVDQTAAALASQAADYAAAQRPGVDVSAAAVAYVAATAPQCSAAAHTVTASGAALTLVVAEVRCRAALAGWTAGLLPARVEVRRTAAAAVDPLRGSS